MTNGAIEEKYMWEIHSATQTISVKKRGAVLCSLKLFGEEIIAETTDAPLFEVVALDTAHNRHVFRPDEGTSAPDGSIIYEVLHCGDTQAQFRVQMTPQKEPDGSVSIGFSLSNRDTIYTPVSMLCMNVHGIKLGEDAASNVLLYPHHAGEKIVNPAQTIRSERYFSFWRAGTVMEDGLYVRENNYCGLMSMSWMYLQNEQLGLYMASHDARFPVTGLRMLSGGKDWMGFAFRIHRLVQKGKTEAFGPFVFAAEKADWHAGAKRYRRWIGTYLAEHRVPDFLREESGLHQCYAFKRMDGVHNRFADIPELFDRGMEAGLRHMFIASWNRTGFDSCYPEYYPDMDLGTALDFRRGLRYVKEHGGFTTLYVNARIFDQKSDYHGTLGEAMAITDPHQVPLTENYTPNTFTLNCPSDETWQHHLVDICDFSHEAYGAQGIYLDQLASAEPFPCYHEGHTHADVGEFNQGYLRILDVLRERLWARNPDNYLMTENCGDIYSPYVWANLTWNGAPYDEFYNMFRYTFPEFDQVNMVNPRSWEPDAAKREALFYSDIERCVLMGNILWIGLCSRFDEPSMEKERAYVLNALELRKAIAPWLARGTYVDDAYVQRVQNVTASCFDLGEKEVLLLVGDAMLQGGTATFSLPFAPEEYQVHTEEDGKAVEVCISGTEIAVTPHGQRLTAVCLRARCM